MRSFALLCTLCLCLVACGNTNSELTVADVLPQIKDATQITLDYAWAGLNIGAPYHVHTRLPLQPLPSQGVLTIAVGGYSKPTRTQTLTTELAQAQWNKAARLLQTIPLQNEIYKPNITHTDDYPSLEMTFEGSDFTATFRSKSQGAHYLPWEAIIQGKSYTITSETIFSV